MIRATAIAGALVLLGAASPALAQHKEISPYIEISQVVTDNFTTGDVLTYSQVAAGVDAAVTTHNAAAQVSYRYEHSFSWDDDVGDDDVHQGLARAAVKVGQALTIEGGALATRARSDIRGDAAGFDGPQVDNVTQVYAFYAGPTLATRAGPGPNATSRSRSSASSCAARAGKRSGSPAAHAERISMFSPST